MRNTPSILLRTMLFCVLAALLLLPSSESFARRKSIVQYVHQIWSTANGMPQNSAGSMLQTRDGYIWFATQEGLARFDGMEFRVFDRVNTKELPISWMVRLKEDSSGALWMRPAGFAPGMVRYKDGMFKKIDTSNGLPSQPCDHLGERTPMAPCGSARRADSSRPWETSSDPTP